jgi:hypothetical protein
MGSRLRVLFIPAPSVTWRDRLMSEAETTVGSQVNKVRPLRRPRAVGQASA